MIEAIENAFVADAEAIDGIRAALGYEPEQLPVRPCVTMLLTKTDQAVIATGGITEGMWEWRINLYVDLKDFKVAQSTMKGLIPSILSITRLNPKLTATCDIANVTDLGIPPTFSDGMIVKQLLLTAQVQMG